MFKPDGTAYEGPEEYPVPDVLMVRRLPYRLSRMQFGGLINCRDRNAIGSLVEKKIVPVLGDPRKGDPLWFATTVIQKLASDPRWLHKVTVALKGYVRQKKQKRKEAPRE
jgi:hypothetical protein